VVFDPRGHVALIATNAAVHRARGRSTGDPARRLGRRAKRIGRGLRIREAGRGRRYVYGVKNGRISFVALAGRSISRSPGALRAYVEQAGLR
jgi:hypothetical protein